MKYNLTNESDETLPGKDVSDNTNVNTGEGGNRKKILIITLVVVAIIATLWIWKNIQLKNEREEAKRERQVLQDRATAMVTGTHKEHLRLLAKPYIYGQ